MSQARRAHRLALHPAAAQLCRPPAAAPAAFLVPSTAAPQETVRPCPRAWLSACPLWQCRDSRAAAGTARTALFQSRTLEEASETRILYAFTAASWQLVQRARRVATPAAAACRCGRRRTAGALRCDCLPPRSDAPRRVGEDALHQCASYRKTLCVRCLSISHLGLLDGALVENGVIYGIK